MTAITTTLHDNKIGTVVDHLRGGKVLIKMDDQRDYIVDIHNAHKVVPTPSLLGTVGPQDASTTSHAHDPSSFSSSQPSARSAPHVLPLSDLAMQNLDKRAENTRAGLPYEELQHIGACMGILPPQGNKSFKECSLEPAPMQKAEEKLRSAKEKTDDAAETDTEEPGIRQQPAETRAIKPKQPHTPGFCRVCGVTESRQWRKGPQGSRTLCNSCGIKWNRNGTLKEGSQSSDTDGMMASPETGTPEAAPTLAAVQSLGATAATAALGMSAALGEPGPTAAPLLPSHADRSEAAKQLCRALTKPNKVRCTRQAVAQCHGFCSLHPFPNTRAGEVPDPAAAAATAGGVGRSSSDKDLNITIPGRDLPQQWSAEEVSNRACYVLSGGLLICRFASSGSAAQVRSRGTRWVELEGNCDIRSFSNTAGVPEALDQTCEIKHGCRSCRGSHGRHANTTCVP